MTNLPKGLLLFVAAIFFLGVLLLAQEPFKVLSTVDDPTIAARPVALDVESIMLFE
jgi:hypothetical protein